MNQIIENKNTNNSFVATIFTPQKNIKGLNHLVITLNNQPLLGLGEYEENSSHFEANELLKSKEFVKIIANQLENETDILAVKKINGYNLNWNEKEYAVSTNKNGELNLYWVAFGNKAKEISQSLVNNQEIINIMLNSINKKNELNSLKSSDLTTEHLEISKSKKNRNR